MVRGIEAQFGQHPLDGQWYIHNGEMDEDAMFLNRAGEWTRPATYWPTEAAARAFATEGEGRE